VRQEGQNAMTTGLMRKRVIVLSDHKVLSRAIEFTLQDRLGVEVVGLGWASPGQREMEAQVGDLDLMVVAVSLPSSEPVVALAAASLSKKIGQVPLLIISDRPFYPHPNDKIFHLNFPFDLDGLPEKVQGILEKTSRRDVDGWTYSGCS
jgi:hypothetical protein